MGRKQIRLLFLTFDDGTLPPGGLSMPGGALAVAAAGLPELDIAPFHATIDLKTADADTLDRLRSEFTSLAIGVAVCVIDGYDLAANRSLINLLSIDGGLVARDVRAVACGRLVEEDPAAVLDWPGVSAVVLGDLDDALAAYVQQLHAGEPGGRIKGVLYRHDGRIVDGGADLISELDALPFADRTLIDEPDLAAHGVATICIGRPVPKSAICSGSNGRSGGVSVRFRSADDICDEIDALCEDHPDLSAVCFPQPFLTLDERWLAGFARVYVERCGLPFSTNVFPAAVTEEAARVLADAGCSRVRLVASHGDMQSTADSREALARVIRAAGQVLDEVGIRVERDEALDALLQQPSRRPVTASLAHSCEPVHSNESAHSNLSVPRFDSMMQNDRGLRVNETIRNDALRDDAMHDRVAASTLDDEPHGDEPHGGEKRNGRPFARDEDADLAESDLPEEESLAVAIATPSPSGAPLADSTGVQPVNERSSDWTSPQEIVTSIPQQVAQSTATRNGAKQAAHQQQSVGFIRRMLARIFKSTTL